IFIRAYQHAHPDEVAGLVFANSSHRVGMVVNGKGGLLWDLSEAELRSAYPLPATATPPRPTREGEPFDRLPADLQAARLWLEFLSSNSVHVSAEDSGHEIHLYKPDLVVQTVLRAVASVRNRGSR